MIPRSSAVMTSAPDNLGQFMQRASAPAGSGSNTNNQEGVESGNTSTGNNNNPDPKPPKPPRVPKAKTALQQARAASWLNLVDLRLGFELRL